MSNIKIGDKVIIPRVPAHDEYDKWNDSWVPSMNGFLQVVVTVAYIDGGRFYIEEDDGGYGYPLFLAELVENDIILPEPEIKAVTTYWLEGSCIDFSSEKEAKRHFYNEHLRKVNKAIALSTSIEDMKKHEQEFGMTLDKIRELMN